MPAMVTVTREVRVAAGVFAPGHLGELTALLPFELVDDVLELTGAVQRRLRLLPSRAGMYFVLALALFGGLGYAQVWDRLTAGLAGLGLRRPSEKGLRDLRRRLGPGPLKALFEVVAGPLAAPWVPGVSWRGLRTVAFDGCSSLRVPDTARNRAWLGRIRHKAGFAGYPLLHLLTLAETGTRGLLGAVTGAAADGGEIALATQLLHLLTAGMLVLADRAYDAGDFLAAVAATGAQFLVRGKASRSPAVLERLPDGSYLSDINGLQVRIIQASVRVAGADGSGHGEDYRLITTLTDHRRFPAADLVRLYHERWEIETAYYALRHTLLNGRVLRSGDRPGLEQETWALLTSYQLLRMAITDALATHPHTDPDRASFTAALHTARDTITTASGISPDGPAAPSITRAVHATLHPPRRPRYSARQVKSPRSRYPARDGTRPALPAAITAITITITSPPPGPRHTRPSPATRRKPRPATLRHHVITLMTTTPGHPWTSHDLATHLSLKPATMLSHLAHWAKAGLLTRTAPATYTPPSPP
jgi:hypothetical protein